MPRTSKEERQRPQAPRRARPVERYQPDPGFGLSQEQVAARVRQGLHNGDSGIKTKTEGQIIRENVFTFFNLLNFALALAVILVGSPRSALFMGVIFSNILIGSFQGIRAKRTIDKLSLIPARFAVAVLFVIVLLFDSGLIGRTVKNVFNRGKKQRGEAEKNA